MSHLARDTLVTSFIVSQDKNQIIVIFISEFRSFKDITFKIGTDILRDAGKLKKN